MKKITGFTVLLGLIIVFFSCKEKTTGESATSKDRYFSIRQFGLDQWNNFGGPSFVILKTVRKDNGRIDSSLTNSDTINWAPIFKTFFETDISDPKYLGKYKFSQFDDTQDETHNFFYEALDDDLFTQKLLITIDQYTSRIKGIYVETQEKKFIMGEVIRKLYYKPYHTIQISTDSKSMFGSKSFELVQYDFML